MFVLDTNIVSELRKISLGRADARVAAWANVADPATFYISAITVLELETGVLRSESRDPKQGTALRAWLDGRVMMEFRDRILPVDETVAKACARLHVPDPRPERDALIAATALVHGMTVVTQNVDDFAVMGVSVLNPWII